MPIYRTVLLLSVSVLLGHSASASRVTVPGTTVSVDVPAGFVPMPKSVIDTIYSRGSSQGLTVYSTPGPDWDVNIAFALRDQTLPAGNLAPVQATMERTIAPTPGLRWVKRGVVRSGGREWIDLQFWVKPFATESYNHVRVTRQGQKTLVVTAIMTKAQYSRYGARLDAALNGLK